MVSLPTFSVSVDQGPLSLFACADYVNIYRMPCPFMKWLICMCELGLEQSTAATVGTVGGTRQCPVCQEDFLGVFWRGTEGFLHLELRRKSEETVCLDFFVTSAVE